MMIYTWEFNIKAQLEVIRNYIQLKYNYNFTGIYLQNKDILNP